MKRILWLATGGTIASRPSEEGLVPGYTAEQILGKVPKLTRLVDVDTLELMSLDSTNLQPKDWILIGEKIVEFYPSYDGFVISHGTDTLAWTSCALSCMLKNLGKPVVVVGSQLTIDEAGSDAEANLIAAFTMASKGHGGVFAVCGGQIMLGLWAKKLFSEDLASINSVNYPPLATFTGEEIYWNNIFLDTLPKVKGAVALEANIETRVFPLKIIPGLNVETVYNLAKASAGIVVEAYGAGGIPYSSVPEHDILGALSQMVKAGKPVVCVSQCTYNGVHMKRYEVGQRALNLGIISGGSLSVEAATVKLMTALGKKKDLKDIADIFAEYI